MNNRIKNILLAIIAALAIALVGKSFMGPGAQHGNTPGENAIVGPLAHTGLRFDGYYRNQIGDLIYLIRFFPEGRVVSVNGTKDRESDLPGFLIRETKGNPGLGLHNVPVNLVGDSLVFVTRPEKGEIEYRGAVVSSSMVRFVRHSHITGTRQLMEYIFYEDGTAPSQEDSTQVVEPS